LNILLRNIASDQVSLWTHIVRRRENVYPRGECPAGFSREVDEHYRERVTGETLMVNELYLSVVFRPQAGMVQGAAMKLLSKATDRTRPRNFATRSMHARNCASQL
jgi:type IV secretion system protein VirB4